LRGAKRRGNLLLSTTRYASHPQATSDEIFLAFTDNPDHNTAGRSGIDSLDPEYFLESPVCHPERSAAKSKDLASKRDTKVEPAASK